MVSTSNAAHVKADKDLEVARNAYHIAYQGLDTARAAYDAARVTYYDACFAAYAAYDAAHKVTLK